MASFKGFKSTKAIVINEEGDVINLPRDMTFLKTMQNVADQYATNCAKVTDMESSEVLDHVIGETKKMMEWYNSHFGDDAADKTFGEKCVPLPDTVVSFFDYLIEQSDIAPAKYSTMRKGGKK